MHPKKFLLSSGSFLPWNWAAGLLEAPSLVAPYRALLRYYRCDTPYRAIPFPKGPKIEKIQDRPPGLKISSGIEIFKRATRQSPIFVGKSEGPGLKFSSEIEIFDRD